VILYAFFFKEPQEEDREWKSYSLRQALLGLEEELYAEETSRYAGSEASFSVIPKIFKFPSALIGNPLKKVFSSSVDFIVNRKTHCKTNCQGRSHPLLPL
jgi:hypothetical protein